MKNRIALKLVFCFLGMSGVLTVLTTALQNYYEYRQDLLQLSASMGRLLDHKKALLEELVVRGDDLRLGGLLDEFVKQEWVTYAAIMVGDTAVLDRGERSPQGLSSVQVLNTGMARQVVVQVDADLRDVRDKSRKRFLRLLLSNGAQIFLVAAFLFLMVQFLVTRHLGHIAAQLCGLDLSRAEGGIRLKREPGRQPDELDQVVATMNAMHDRAQEAFATLERNEQRLLLFFDSTEEAIIGVDRDGACTFINDACLNLLGSPGYEQSLGKHLHELFIHTPGSMEQATMEECLVFRSMELGRSLTDDEGYAVLPNGSRLPVSLRSYPVFERGRVSGALVFLTDNGQTRSLKREMTLLSEAIKQVPILVVIADCDDRILYVNPATERMTGYTRDEILGRDFQTFRQLVQSDEETTRELDDSLRQGRKWEGVVETMSKWGTPLNFYAIISPVVDESGKVARIITVAREVSYEIGLQDELIQAKKMEAVGRLSASFAHEFGNPLFGVRAVLKDFLNRDLIDNDMRKLLEMAMEECDRMRDMIRKFQELYRDSSTGGERESLERIIQQILDDVGPLMEAAHVDYSLMISEAARHVVVDRGKIMLSIRNVVVNAVESMSPAGGILTINVAREKRFVTVLIGDGGSGIREEHNELVFEPFFSTKQEVEGAGLGLPVAYGTIMSIGGTISFHSSPGEGTTFTIRIPV